MATKTITLTGAEVAVTGLDGAHAHIRNDSTDTIYAAKMPGITAGADGVASIPAGQADTLRGISGAVYLLGTGSALIQSDDYVESPFKASTASGGSAVDDVARAAVSAHAGNADIHVTADEKASWNGKAELSDIPTTLPANGGNSTYVQGYAPKDSGAKGLPVITSDYGHIEIGKYLDFHTADGQDYKVRITANDDGTLSFSGAINANTTGSAATITSTLPVTKGGTGQTTANDAANTLINSLDLGNSAPQDDDYYVCQYAGGGEGNTNYYRRPTSKLYEYINQKLTTSKDFLQNLGRWNSGNIDDLILGANKSGIVWIESTVTGMPVEGKYWFGIIDCSNIHRCLRVTSQTDGQSFVRAYNSSTQYWYAWHNVADGGNAASVGAYTEAKLTELEARIAALEGGTS